MRDWRASQASKIRPVLTADEWARILAFRALGGAGDDAGDPRGRGLRA
jgi:hypothetical protein